MPSARADAARIEDQHDRAVAEDGLAGKDLQMRERGVERLDDDFLHVEDRIDPDAERLRADAG